MESLKSSQLMLRVPENLVTTIKKLVREGREEDKTANIVEITPEAQQDHFQFTVNGWSYPALLENMPTVLEAHKTFDRKIFLKSGDIGQILTVFNNAAERDQANQKVSQSVTGERVQASGLSPPTANIVKNRFEKTRKKAGLSVQYVRLVVEDILANWVQLSSSNQEGDSACLAVSHTAPKSGRGRSGGPKTRNLRTNVQEDQNEVLEITEEEVVDFEDWMVSPDQPDGISISISGKDCAWLKEPRYAILSEHPEILKCHDEYFGQMVEAQQSSRDVVLKIQRSSVQADEAGLASMSSHQVFGSSGSGSDINNHVSMAVDETPHGASDALSDSVDNFAIFETEDDFDANDDVDIEAVDEQQIDENPDSLADTKRNESDIVSSSSNAVVNNDPEDLEAFFQMSESDEDSVGTNDEQVDELDEEADGELPDLDNIDVLLETEVESGDIAVSQQTFTLDVNDEDIGLDME